MAVVRGGERLPVTITHDSSARYDLDDLVQWIGDTRALISRKATAPAGNGNAFLAVGSYGGGAAVDVDERLAAMTHQGAGDTSIHATQLSTTAALLNRGMSTDEVVRAVLEATRAAAGDAGARWNWRAEEKTIRSMCDAWARKRANGQIPARRPHALDDLMTVEFKPMEHFIPDLIPAEGVVLLASKPKVGKSWMLYDICISAPLGRELLGGRKAKQGHCLYLALEDSQRRLRARAEKLLAYHMGPCPGVYLETEWARVDAGGLDHIEEWVIDIRAQGHAVVCVCIDVLQMIRPLGGDRQSVYQRDYMALQGLRALAAKLHLVIIVAHHQRKGSADDLQDTISGTQGLAGAADCSIVLERQIGGGGFVLDVRGRDIEAVQLNAVFDKDLCRWTIGGDASEARMSEARRLILEALRTTPGGMTPREISDDTALKFATVRGTLARMRKDGVVTKKGGRYSEA